MTGDLDGLADTLQQTSSELRLIERPACLAAAHLFAFYAAALRSRDPAQVIQAAIGSCCVDFSAVLQEITSHPGAARFEQCREFVASFARGVQLGAAQASAFLQNQ